MRLSEKEAAIIRAAAERRFGPSTRVLLFGSRIDDRRRGGDIDLMVELQQAIDNPLAEAVALEIDLMRELGERKVDVLLVYPGYEERPIHRIARATGMRL
jgi:predicted nucleotidyltransferase